MGQIIRTPNGNAIYLTPRSASHSIAAACLESFWPDLFDKYHNDNHPMHPAAYIYSMEGFIEQSDLAIILRNPIERFRSMCAHKPNISLEDHLNKPVYHSLPQNKWIKIFLFETQLQECADWLGITIPLQKIDSTKEKDKPILTPEQETIVRQIYADDLTLWESLQPSS